MDAETLLDCKIFTDKCNIWTNRRASITETLYMDEYISLWKTE